MIVGPAQVNVGIGDQSRRLPREPRRGIRDVLNRHAPVLQSVLDPEQVQLPEGFCVDEEG